ncbi:hypothetical protein ZWY2020_013807 [Hordeum vulgare]|nr:hypothetical protein ZWY2020_013807 [Hordeum vulgare]
MAAALHHLWGVHHHVPDSHVVDIQVGHHLDGVKLILHTPDSAHHGPDVAPHHGYRVAVPNHVLHHAVEELSQLAARNPVQKLPKLPQNSHQGCQDQFFSS